MEAGGVKYLVRQAELEPVAFLGLLGKVIPREVHQEITAEVRVRQEVRRDLVEKLCILLTTAPTENIEHETPPAPLPAIAHKPDAMLKAQAITGADELSRRGENARKEGLLAVTGVVQRAAAMHMERSKASGNPGDIRTSGHPDSVQNSSGSENSSGAGAEGASIHTGVPVPERVTGFG